VEKEQYLEKLYELIETCDYEKLSEKEQLFVLNYITAEEYKSMRATLSDTKSLLSKYPEIPSIEKSSVIRRIITYPVELYKIAVIIIICISIALIIAQLRTSNRSDYFVKGDTTFIERTDTILLEKINTIEVVKERLVYNPSSEKQNQISKENIIAEPKTSKIDCAKEFCPDDIEIISELKSKNNFSKDRLLTNFIVSMN